MGRGARRRPKLLDAKLRAIRERLGRLSQSMLVERLGIADYVNPNEISDFERGVREPDLLTLKAYADVAGISTDVLIDDALDLPDELPAIKRIGRARENLQKGRTVAAVNATTVMLWLPIKSEGGSAGEERRARNAIEKAHLKQYGFKKLRDDEYELSVSYQDDTDLDEQIYALFGAITTEAKRRKCSVKIDFREKDGDRYW
jgi:transcriptional regulator with XRE-family HTH domain